MADKTYTIVVDVEINEKRKLSATSKDLKAISENAESAANNIKLLSENISENSKELEKNNKQQEGLTKKQQEAAHTTGSFAAKMAEGAAQGYAMRMAMHRFVGMLPIIGTALAIVTAAIVVYNTALKSANDYLNANVDAQNKMFKNTTAATAWSKIWQDVSISFGKFFHSFRDFWAFTKDIAGEEFLKKIGLGNYVSDAKKVEEATIRLNQEWEKSLTTIQKLVFESEDYLKIVNNENFTNKERLEAAQNWSKAQMQILDIQRQKLKDQETINKAERNRSVELENELEVINRGLQENQRLRDNVVVSTAEMSKAILTNKDALVEEYEALEKIAKLFAKDLKSEDEEAITLSQFISPEQAAAFAEAKYLTEYGDRLDEALISMAGSWANYFDNIQFLGEGFSKWNELDTQKRIKLAMSAADTSLAIAAMITNELAQGADQNFETQKKFKISEATINTIQGMVAAFTGAMQLGPIAGPIVGGLLAAAVGVFGFSNVSKIKNEKPGGSGAGGGASVPNISIPQQGGAPGFGLINPLTSGEASISSAFDTAQQPIQAYVVSSHVSSQQELDRNIVANAEI